MLDTRPNHTIYINNLNEKIKKDGKFNKKCKLNIYYYLKCIILI